MVQGDAVGDVLHEHGLARAGRGDDEGALALAQGGHEVHHPGGQLLGIPLHLQHAGGVERNEVVEVDPVLGAAGRIEVDGVDAQHGEEFLFVLGRPDHARQGVAGSQVEFADLARGDVDVIGTGQIVVLRGPQEAETLGQDFQHAFGEEQPLTLGLGLLAHGQGTFDPVGFGHFRKPADGLLLQVLEAQNGRGLGFN